MTKNKKNEKFAVIKLAGTQLKVYEGVEYDVNKLDANKGEKIEIKDVLLVFDGKETRLGEPLVKEAKVILEVVSQKKDKKVEVFKYKAKSRYRKSAGHRALISRVLVKEIK